MKKLIAVTVFGVAMSLLGCGGGAKLAANKQATADAFYSASRAGTGAGGQSLLEIARQNASGSVDVTANCDHGGKATIHYTFDTNNTSGDLTFDLIFAGCNDNGKTAVDGTLHTTLSVSATDTSAALAYAMKGKITFSGEVSDFIDADITETISATVTSTTASASVTLNGSLTTSSGSYTWTNETVTVNADIPAESGSSTSGS